MTEFQVGDQLESIGTIAEVLAKDGGLLACGYMSVTEKYPRCAKDMRIRFTRQSDGLEFTAVVLHAWSESDSPATDGKRALYGGLITLGFIEV